jgi:shikimate 5-dehydrogenase
METLIVTTRDKKSANQIKKTLKNMREVENVKSLSEEEKEDIGLINAINKGFTGKYIDVEVLQKKLRS